MKQRNDHGSTTVEPVASTGFYRHKENNILPLHFALNAISPRPNLFAVHVKYV